MRGAGGEARLLRAVLHDQHAARNRFDRAHAQPVAAADRDPRNQPGARNLLGDSARFDSPSRRDRFDVDDRERRGAAGRELPTRECRELRRARDGPAHDHGRKLRRCLDGEAWIGGEQQRSLRPDGAQRRDRLGDGARRPARGGVRTRSDLEERALVARDGEAPRAREQIVRHASVAARPVEPRDGCPSARARARRRAGRGPRSAPRRERKRAPGSERQRRRETRRPSRTAPPLRRVPCRRPTSRTPPGPRRLSTRLRATSYARQRCARQRCAPVAARPPGGNALGRARLHRVPSKPPMADGVLVGAGDRYVG